MSVEPKYESIYKTFFWLHNGAYNSETSNIDLKIKAVFKKFVRNIESTRTTLNAIRSHARIFENHLFSSVGELYFLFLKEAVVLFSQTCDDRATVEDLKAVYLQFKILYADKRLIFQKNEADIKALKEQHDKLNRVLQERLVEVLIPWDLLSDLFSMMMKDHIADVNLIELFHSESLNLEINKVVKVVRQAINVGQSTSDRSQLDHLYFRPKISFDFLSSYLPWFIDLLKVELEDFAKHFDNLKKRAKQNNLDQATNEKFKPVIKIFKERQIKWETLYTTTNHEIHTIIQAISDKNFGKVSASIEKILEALSYLKKQEHASLTSLEKKEIEEIKNLKQSFQEIENELYYYFNAFIEHPLEILSNIADSLGKMDCTTLELHYSEVKFLPVTDAFIGLQSPPQTSFDADASPKTEAPKNKGKKAKQKGKKRSKKGAVTKKKSSSAIKGKKVVSEIETSASSTFQESVLKLKSFSHQILGSVFKFDLSKEARIHLYQSHWHLRWLISALENISSAKAQVVFLNYQSALSHAAWSVEQLLHAEHWSQFEKPPLKEMQHQLIRLAHCVNLTNSTILEELKLINQLERYGLESQLHIGFHYTFFPEINAAHRKAALYIDIMTRKNINPQVLKDEMEDLCIKTAEWIESNIFPKLTAKDEIALKENMPQYERKVFDDELLNKFALLPKEIEKIDFSETDTQADLKMQQVHSFSISLNTALQEVDGADHFNVYGYYTYKALRLSQNMLAGALNTLLYLQEDKHNSSNDIPYLINQIKDLNLHVGSLFHGMGQKTRYPLQIRSNSMGSQLIDRLVGYILSGYEIPPNLQSSDELLRFFLIYPTLEKSFFQTNYHKRFASYLNDLYTNLLEVIEQLKTYHNHFSSVAI